MIGVILLAVVGLGYETWALVYRRHHPIAEPWEATISEGVWTMVAWNKWARVVFWLLWALAGAHLAFGVP